MAVSQYFAGNMFSNEQNLYENLIIESVKQYGVNCYYIPRLVINPGKVMREPQIERFASNYIVEIFIESYEKFSGDGEFLSIFQNEIRNQINFIMPKRTFATEVSNNMDREPNITYRTNQPSEGDLIWIPMFRKAWQLEKVDPEAFFYQLGNLPVYRFTAEAFEYSNQIFETGIPELDDKYNKLYSANKPDDFNLQTVDVSSQNGIFTSEREDVVAFCGEDFDFL